MRFLIARILFAISLSLFILSCFMLRLKIEPFYTHYFLFAWWSAIGMADSYLFLKGTGSLLIEKPADFFFFLVPFSSFLWFVFEAFNLRIHNWQYLQVPREIWIRWPGYFFAFGTVLPGLFLTENLLEHWNIFPKNDFSGFFTQELPQHLSQACVFAGILMLVLPLVWPPIFFPLVWGGFVLLLDPVNALWNRRSLIQEWRQKNWGRTLGLLSAGLFCGILWELWNFWAGAKWVYTVPLPNRLLKDLKIFEMPLYGFLGFPPFALECFVMLEFTRNLKTRLSAKAWNSLAFCSVLFSLSMCRMIDLHTVRSFHLP